MTDLPGSAATSSLSPQGQALPTWDPLLRLAHWGIAAVVIANYAFTSEGGSVHIALGWAGLALLILRLVWGFVGPMEARFSSFPPNPAAALRHLRGLLRGQAPQSPSHNPAGALMAYALWACLATLTLTGLVMNGGTSPLKQAALEAAVAAGDWSVVSESGEKPEDEGASGSLLKEVHEVAANLIILLALLHVAGVAVESRLMRRNLVAPMLSSQRDRRK